MRKKIPWFIGLIILLSGLGCTLGSPFNQIFTFPTETPTQSARVALELRPTFTVTPDWTATPTNTATPLLTATPTRTETPINTPMPDATETPEPTDTLEPTQVPPPTNTRPPPPPPTATPIPAPTNTPEPQWDFRIEEVFFAPSNANILSIVVAIQNHNNDWLAGLRVVGVDPNGIVTKSEPSADKETGYTPAASSVVKSGNTKFEPQPVAVYITGTWFFHLESADGRQVSEPFTVNMDVENRQWYFFRFVPNG